LLTFWQAAKLKKKQFLRLLGGIVGILPYAEEKREGGKQATRILGQSIKIALKSFFINFILSSDLKKSKRLLFTLNSAIFNTMYYLFCAQQAADISLIAVQILNTTYNWSIDREISAVAVAVLKTTTPYLATLFWCLLWVTHQRNWSEIIYLSFRHCFFNMEFSPANGIFSMWVPSLRGCIQLGFSKNLIFFCIFLINIYLSIHTQISIRRIFSKL